MSPSIGELATALIAVQGELPKVKKGKVNPFFKRAYAGLETVMPAVLEVLSAHDLAVLQTIGGDGQGGTTLSTTLLHKSGEWVSDTQPLMLTKPDPQSQGSAITYGRRYAVMSLLGLVADDDDDGNAASPRDSAPVQRTQPRQAAPKRADASPPIDAYERKARELEKGERQAEQEIQRSSKEQHGFIRSLVEAMFGGDAQAEVSCIAAINAHAVNDAATEIHLIPLSKGEASAMIDALQKMQQAEPQPKLEPVGADPGPARDA